jgi:hypothetical protein
MEEKQDVVFIVFRIYSGAVGREFVLAQIGKTQTDGFLRLWISWDSHARAKAHVRFDRGV